MASGPPVISDLITISFLIGEHEVEFFPDEAADDVVVTVLLALELSIFLRFSAAMAAAFLRSL